MMTYKNGKHYSAGNGGRLYHSEHSEQSLEN